MNQTLAAACVALVTALPLRATADTAEVEDYVAFNLIAIFYHELGHALIDVMALPVFGQEEDAADVLSALMIDAVFEEDSATDILYATAFSFLSDAEAMSRSGQEPAYWAVHGPDLQRYYTLVCLFYGANPDARDDIADDLGLPVERAETCADEFDLANDSWGPVLDDLYAAGPGNTLVLDPPRRFNDRWAALTAEVIAEEVAALNDELSLPVPVGVLVEPCGEANAFYDPGTRDIILCTEFAAYLAHQVNE